MNLRSTTPFSNSTKARKSGNAKRVFIFTIAMILGGASAATYFQASPVSADKYDDKIKALQANMKQYQAQADKLNSQATTLANALAQITNEKNALEAQVAISQAQYDKLVVQIAETEQQINDNKDALGTTLADLYVDDEISPIEMLASSQSLGDFLNKQEYRNAIKDQLSATIKKVKELKAQLTQQKTEVAAVLAKQKAARDEVAAKVAEQSRLLAQTKNDEATYQNLIRDSASQIAAARAAQAALRARTNATGGYVLVDAGSLSAYPWNSSNCTMGGPGGWYSFGGSDGQGHDGGADGIGSDGYGCRQCASYVAWRIAAETGKYYYWGNGGDFASRAVAAGYPNLGHSPQPGSIAVMWGNPGHVAWVEAVSDNGSQVLVSQYNYDYGAGYGMYSKMWLSVNFFDQYVKIK